MTRATGLEARPLPIHLCLLGAQTGAASGRQGRSGEAGARQRDPLRPDVSPVHCPRRQATIGLPDRIELALHTPSDGIGNPAVDGGFMPAAPVDADLYLR